MFLFYVWIQSRDTGLNGNLAGPNKNMTPLRVESKIADYYKDLAVNVTA